MFEDNHNYSVSGVKRTNMNKNMFEHIAQTNP